MDDADLRNRFMFHENSRTDNAGAHAAIRQHCLDLARLVDQLLPDGREKSTAITNLEQVMMWANAGIARRLP